jgi:hypothetical protein
MGTLVIGLAMWIGVQQKLCVGGAPPKNDPDCIPAQKAIDEVYRDLDTALAKLDRTPLPLKCEKYQHVYHWPGSCGPANCNEQSMTCTAVCTPPPADKCVDDMHEVTEREWQELMKRLNWLHEEVLCAKDPKCAISDTKLLENKK